MAKPVIIAVVGTRPDTIKTAPVVQELRRYSDVVTTLLVSTGQHREMLAQALGTFGLVSDFDLDIMETGQSLAQITTRALSGLDPILERTQPSWVLAQGDTSTTFVAGLAAFYRQIRYGHVEAGLRTDSIWNPFPEEFNRRAVGLFAAHHYAPTTQSAQNLLREGIDPSTVFVTGNTGIDAVKFVAKGQGREWYPGDERVILLTTHRRENWGEPMANIARAARRIVDAFPDTRLCVALHRNPGVRNVIVPILENHARIDLIDPPDYADFSRLMARSNLILTDSGGVQEEAPAFGRPVLVLRMTTERPEGVDAGVAKLIGTDEEAIFAEGSLLLSDPAIYDSFARSASPYGDGLAAARIRYVLLQSLGIESEPEAMWTS